MTAIDTTEPREPRTVITTAQVRAQDLQDDDFILVGNQWRALFDIHRSSKSVTSMIAADEKSLAEIAQEIASIRMDTQQDGQDGRQVQSAIRRPGVHPAVFEADRITVARHAGNGTSAMAPVRTTSAIAALLDAGEYIAARWVRDEASDGSIVEDAWAVFRQWDLVTIQIEQTVEI